MRSHGGRQKFDSTPQRGAIVTLSLAGVVFAVLILCDLHVVSSTGIAIPPPNLDSFTTDSSKCPSASAYVGKRVALSGRISMDSSGASTLQCPRGGDLPHPWFKDAGITAAVVISPHTHVDDGDYVEVTGIISVASAGAWSTQLNVTIAADAIHSVAGDNQEQARAPGLQELPSAFTPLIFLLLVPLCIRSVIVLLSPALKNPSQHRCPYCSYDCRGSPLRCPECGSAVGVPNFRLDLNPKSREA